MHENELFKARSINLFQAFLVKGHVVTKDLKQARKSLNKLDPRLNKIILPSSKIDMMINWWNNTIRFETDIPKTFNAGYLVIENEYLDKKYYRDDLREISKLFEANIYQLDERLQRIYKKEIQYNDLF